MKLSLFLLIIVFATACSFYVPGKRVKMRTQESARIAHYGAKARITFRIIDESDNVVTGASVKVSFARSDSKWIKGISDEKGLFAAKGKSSGNLFFDVDKAGYYQTSGEYSYGGEGDIIFEDGHFLPWNPTNTLILKKVKNPVAMHAVQREIPIPVKGTNVAFDMETGDWVKPYGKGIYGDLIVNCDAGFSDAWTGFRKMELTFGTNTLDGVRRFKRDGFSQLWSIYEAPLDGYEKSVSWSCEAWRNKKDVVNEPPPDEYYVFRVRTVVDEKGQIVKANYGKIYGPVKYGFLGDHLKLGIMYYFNPEVNSRNLEFDTSKNLSKQRIPCP